MRYDKHFVWRRVDVEQVVCSFPFVVVAIGYAAWVCDHSTSSQSSDRNDMQYRAC